MNNLREQASGVSVEVVREPHESQKQSIRKLQKIAFSAVGNIEAEEDFYDPPAAQVIAYIERHLVGWAGVHITEQLFEGMKVRLGGYGICTHPRWQGRGIATQVSRVAMSYLEEHGCDIAFLSVDTSNLASTKLHEKNGFVKLPRDFSWKNSRGQYKHDSGGMIAAVNSEAQFERVLKGTDTFFVGNGYW